MSAIRLLACVLLLIGGAARADIASEIAAYQAEDAIAMPPVGKTLIYGSSSVRQWSTAEAYMLPAVVFRRGFNGAQCTDLNTNHDAMVTVYNPATVVIYCGDNDIHNGITPAAVKTRMETLVNSIKADLPQIKIVIMGIKPSPSRDAEINDQQAANALLQTYAAGVTNVRYVDTHTALLLSGLANPAYYSDGLHLNSTGYGIWNGIMYPVLNAGEQVPTKKCPDGVTYAPEVDYPAQCPPSVSFVGTSGLTTTTATNSFSTDVGNGVAYLYLSSSSTPVPWQTIKSGQGAVRKASQTVTGAGVLSFSLTGLTPNTTLYGSFMHQNAGGRPSYTTTFPLVTPPDVNPPGAIATLYGVFVDCAAANGGNGSTTALSGANAAYNNLKILESISKPPGTDIWIKMGCNFSYDTDRIGYAIPNWSGIPDDSIEGFDTGATTPKGQAIVGGYYLDPGRSNVPTASWQGTLGGRMQVTPAAANLGKIGPLGYETLMPWSVTGSLTPECIAAGLCHYTARPELDFVPDCNSESAGLIKISNSWVTIRGGSIRYSACMAVNVNAAGGSVSNSGVDTDLIRHVRLMDFESYYTGQVPFVWNYGNRHSFMSHVLSRYANYAYTTARLRVGTANAMYTLTYDSGGTTAIQRGDRLSIPIVPISTHTSPATFRVEEVTLNNGTSWGAGNAAGTLYITPVISPKTNDTHSVLTPIDNGIIGRLAWQGDTAIADIATVNGAVLTQIASTYTWGGTNVLTRSLKSYSLRENVTIYLSGGEGNNFFKGSHVIQRGSHVGNVHSGGFYADGFSHVLLDGNVSWDISDDTGGGPGTAAPNPAGEGKISLGYEDGVKYQAVDPPGMRGSVIRNNLLAGHPEMLGMGPENDRLATGSRAMTYGNRWLNNVVIGATGSGMDWKTGTLIDYLDVQNNLFLNYTQAKKPVCHSALNGGYNVWGYPTSLVPPSDCFGTQDVGYSGGVSASSNAGIALNPYNNPNNMGAWQTTDYITPPLRTNAYLAAGSQALGQGNAYWATQNCLLDDSPTGDYALWEPVLKLSTYPYALDTVAKRKNFLKCRYYDWKGTEAVSNVDLGINQGTGGPPPTPDPKNNVLSVSPDGHFLRKNGSPFAVVGCTALGGIHLSLDEMDTYLNDAAEKGCNLVLGPIPNNVAATPYSITGTYTQTGTSITVTMNNHGIVLAYDLPLDFTSGAAVDGMYRPSNLATNTFTVTSAVSATTNGSVKIVNPVATQTPFAMNPAFFSKKSNTTHKFGGLDGFVEKATAKGMFIVMPLQWGPGQKKGVGESAANALTYANYYVGRYNTYNNIIWMPGGEYTKITYDPPTYPSNQDALSANELAIIDAYKNGILASKAPGAGISLHPDGNRSSSQWDRHTSARYIDQDWFMFSQLQSYHSNAENITDTEADYASVNSATTPKKVKPVIQSEMHWENAFGAADSWGTPWSVRLAAYSHSAVGGAGFIYGSDTWDFPTGWQDWLDLPGAEDFFTHYKAFITDHHSELAVPARPRTGTATILPTSVTGVTNPQGTASASTYVAGMVAPSGTPTRGWFYTPKGYPVYVRTANMGGPLKYRWFDPRNGTYGAYANLASKSTTATTFTPPSGLPGSLDNDWILEIVQQ